MNRYRNTLIGMLLTLFVFSGVGAAAQDGKRKADQLTISSQVTDADGNSIPNATIISANLRDSFEADKNGSFSLKTRTGDILVIKASGYESKKISLPDSRLDNGKIVLESVPVLGGEEHRLNNLYGSLEARRSTGAYSIVRGSELESNPTLSLENALGGRLPGLYLLQNNGTPTETSHNIFMRGSTMGNVITIVDGVERDLRFLDPEVIESVQLLKDASLKALYGGIWASGILVVTTKRGKAHENGIKVSMQRGVSAPTRLPKYLNSYDYSRFYNQALDNDGVGELKYPESALNAYKSGSSPILFPDVDFYKEFLNRSMDVTKIGVQMSGGNEIIRYFGQLGYWNEGGLEKHTSYPNSNDVLFMRTAVDGELNSFLTFKAGFNAALQTLETPNITPGVLMNALSGTRPNEFPLLIPGSMVNDPAKEFVFGGTSINTNNPYGLLTQRGYNETKAVSLQSDFSLNIDLDEWIKGLSIRPGISFDIYNDLTLAQGETFAVYEPVGGNGGEDLTFAKIGQDTRSTSQSQTAADVDRNYAIILTTTYRRTFNEIHDISALINYYQLEREVRNVHENPRRQNLGFNVNYMNKDKYLLDFSLNRVGVNTFSPESRFGYFPVMGLGWILTEEDFMSGGSLFDFLKLRASYGVLGSTIFTGDGGFTTRLYQDIWNYMGTIGLSDGNSRVQMTRAGNPDLGFQKSYELNVGFDAQAFDKSLWFSLGYFNNIMDGEITLPDYISGISGLNEGLAFVNYNKTGLQGVEAEAYFNKRLGDLNVNFGGNITYGISNRIQFGETKYPAGAEGLMYGGRPYDVILGHRYNGVFASQADIDNSPLQYYGAVRVGDLKYVDTNNDGIVDDQDRVEIGNNTPRLQYGISLNLNFKAFSVSLFGVGYGQHSGLVANSYYSMSGNAKYSRAIIDGLPNGNPHPKLSYQSNTNNFVTSDYWIANRGFFKLRNAEVGYTLPREITTRIGVNKLRLFARGYNLITISGIKDLDPESLNAGITNYPLFTTFTGGMSLSF
jgi:TonB-dependent starch-binding outer membrane protein SusC